MADYFIVFSCLFDVGEAANIEPALAIYNEIADENDDNPGFGAAPSPTDGPGVLWLHSNDGEPERVIDFVLRCAAAFGLTGRWGFCFALTCSRLRLDGFGGGAHVVDLGTRNTIARADCEGWLAEQLAPAAAGERQAGAEAAL